MKYLFFIYLTFCTTLCADHTIIDKTTQQSFPIEISFEENGKQYDLETTGVATRKKMIFKVYSVAHYLEKGAQKPNQNVIDAIFSSNYAKQLTLKWVRDVGADKIQETFQESLQNAFPGKEYTKHKENIEAFVQFFSKSAHVGDEFVIRWLPDGLIEVFINGKMIGQLSNNEFAKGLWGVWLGKDSVVNRNDLLH